MSFYDDDDDDDGLFVAYGGEMAPGIDEQELKEYEQQQQLREFSVMQRRMRAKRHVERLEQRWLGCV